MTASHQNKRDEGPSGTLELHGATPQAVLMRDFPFILSESLVPTGFESLVRIMHRTGDGRRWADVAREYGHILHPLAQWPGIYAQHDGSSDATHPPTGTMDFDSLRAILEHLPVHDSLYWAVWEGHGIWHSPPVYRLTETPARQYRVFTGLGPNDFTWPGSNTRVSDQSPNLLWPGSGRWVVSTEVDADSTLVGCEASSCRAIVEDPRLEAFPVSSDSDFSWGGDRINELPSWCFEVMKGE